MASKEKRGLVKETSVIIKPVSRFGGLDNIHIALSVLVAILIALLLALSYLKPTIVGNLTSSGCMYGTVNGSCLVPIHNYTQIKSVAEMFLSNYGSVNGSLSLLPFVSNVDSMNIWYLRNSSSWYVSVPARNPVTNQTFYFSMVIRDSNTSSILPLLQTVKPQQTLQNSVVAPGVVRLSGKAACTIQRPLQAYWFIDPYSPGLLNSLSQILSLQKQFGKNLSISLEILFTQYSQTTANTYGVNNTLALGSYTLCASQQSGFSNYTAKLSSVYTNSYLSPGILQSIASSSGFNMSAFGSCLSQAPYNINRQALLGKYYNITFTPSVVTNCQYLSIPQTEASAINYSNRH